MYGETTYFANKLKKCLFKWIWLLQRSFVFISLSGKIGSFIVNFLTLLYI